MGNLMKNLITIGVVLGWATPVRANEQEEIEQLFNDARSEVASRLTSIRSCSFGAEVDEELVQWIVESKDVLKEDVSVSAHQWRAASLPVCGMTAQTPTAPIELSHPTCIAEVSSLPQAGKILLRQTALHLGQRGVEDAIADAVWDQGGDCSQPAQIVTGGIFSCLLYNGQVECWGDLSENGVVPTFHQLKGITAGHLHVCGVDATSVKCWGHTGYGENDIPGLWDPHHISSGDNSACAIDTDGAKCWGFQAYYLAEPPQLEQPSQIVNATKHACAIDNGEVKCWGDDFHGADNAPPFHSAEQVAVADGAGCALEEGRIHCWGAIEADPLPRRSDVTKFDIAGSPHSGYYGCAIFQNRATCWGQGAEGQTTVPQLSNPSQIATGPFHACALDDVGVKCWGSNQFGQTDVPAHLRVLH